MSWFKIRPTASKSAPKVECIVEETLLSEHFQVAKVVRHGFPYQPTALAYDSVQNLLAIGTKSGSIRIIGRPGVDCHIKHEAEFAVIQIMFLVNEGAILTVCADDQLHLWSLRQKKPEIIHSLKFQRERITRCHLPFQSKWLYIGTERGNVHILNVESFLLSGYVINWNKAMELLRKTHPGPVIHLSDNQTDPNKLLIGYEHGLLTLWDLKNKAAECHFNCTEMLKSVSWHHEGKQFVTSHADGSLTTWNVKSPQQLVGTVIPHGRLGRDGKPETCRAIMKVELCTNRNGEPHTIFTGGMPQEKVGQTPTLTIMHGSSTTVLEMEHPIIDFLAVCSTPWNNDFQDANAVVVLLQNDFVVIDLTSPNYLCFENPYPMDIHESPVTACLYFADCPSDLMPAFYSVGYRQKKMGFSDKEWPIKGGEWPVVSTGYEEIIITGHADGSVKFWNAPAVSLQVLYKLKTAKMFDESKCCGPDGTDSLFAVQLIRLCVESRLLCVAGLSHVTLFRFNKQETSVECAAIEISLIYEISDGFESPEMEYCGLPPGQNLPSNSQESQMTCVKLKPGLRKWSAGYQPDLCCLLAWVDGEPPSAITSVTINSRYGLLAFGNESGLAVVDILQKTCLLNIGTPDLYGSFDPHSRAPRSPKLRSTSRPLGNDVLSHCMTPDDVKSPMNEQLSLVRQSSTDPHAPPDAAAVDPSSSFASESDGAGTPNNDPNAVDERSTDDACDREVAVDDDVCNTTTMSHDPHSSENAENVTPTTEVNGGATENSTRSKERTTDHRHHGPPPPRPPPPSSAVPRLSLGQQAAPPASDRDRQRNSLTQRFAGKDLHLNLPQRPSELATGGFHGSDATADDAALCDGSAGRPTQKLLASSWGTIPGSSSACPGSGGSSDRGSCPQTAPVSSKTDGGMRLAGRVNRKLKNYLKFATTHWKNDNRDSATPTSDPSSSGSSSAGGRDLVDLPLTSSSSSSHPRSEPSTSAAFHARKQHPLEFEIVDLTSDDAQTPQYVHSLTYNEYSNLDRTDGATFSRSQSSSISSLENVNKEAIQCLVFAEVLARKSDNVVCPSLWVGTSLGSVLALSVNLPTDGSSRKSEPVNASPNGTVLRLKGSILALAFLDANGLIIPTISESWRDRNKDDQTKDKKTNYSRQQSVSNMKAAQQNSPTYSSNAEISTDQQFIVICSEKQARVLSLPSQTCIYKVKVAETSSVVRADVIPMRDGSCLVCYLLNGHVMTFSLPSLRLLIDLADSISTPDVRVARTFCVSNNCQVVYFCSPTELQKMTLSAETCENLNEMLGELFLPCDMPEAPKPSFFKNLFSAGSATLDREELFGERSGKAVKGVAKYMSGISQSQENANMACSEIGRAKMAAIERGEKLGELEERTTQMMLDSEIYSQRANQIKNKYKDKKWYQF